MPKRTNEFQELVGLVQRALSPAGARITDSAFAVGVDEQNLREIDILIEHETGDYALRIAVEAKDEGRKMTQERFEAILGKYRTASGIDADEVIVVSRMGFSNPVKRRAVTEGICLLTFQEAMHVDWEHRIPTGITLNIAPRVVGFEFEPVIQAVKPDSLVRHGSFVCGKCGKDHGRVEFFVRTALSDRRLIENLRKQASRSDGNGFAKVSWRLPETVVLRTPEEEYPIDRFSIQLQCVCASGNLEVTPYSYGDHVVHHLKGDFAGNQVEFVLTDGIESKSIPLRISHISTVRNNCDNEESASAATISVSPCIPEWFEEWLVKAEDLLSSVSACLVRDQVMYDFAHDSEVNFPVCVKFYLGKGMGYLQTGIVPFESFEAIRLQFSRLTSLVRDCDLDLIACVAPDVPQEGLGDSLYCRAIGSVVDSRSLVSLVPQVAIVSEAVMEFDYHFYTDGGPDLQGNSMETKIITRDRKTVPLPQFCKALDEAMRAHSLSVLKPRLSEKAVYADVHMDFSTALPEATVLENTAGKVFPIKYLKGHGFVRILLAFLEESRLIQAGSVPLIEIFRPKGGWPVLRLPTKLHRHLSIHDTPPLPDPDQVETKLPPSTINRLIPSGLALRRDVEDCVKGASLRIQKHGEPHHWRLKVIPLKAFR